MAYVYVEQVLLENMLINAFALWLALRLIHIPLVWLRIILSALTGSLFGIVMLLFSMPLYLQWAGKVVLSLLLSFIAVPRSTGKKKWLHTAGMFWLVTIILGGASLAMVYFLGGNVFVVGGVAMTRGASPAMLLGGLWLGYALIRWLWLGAFSGILPEQVPVTITQDNVTVQFMALVDTGQTLTEPGSARPIIVVDESQAKKLLPECMRHADTRGKDWLWWLNTATSSGFRNPVCPVGFRSVGGEGMLPGFRMDAVTVSGQKVAATIAVFQGRLDQKGVYHALVPAALVTRQKVFTAAGREKRA
ncbi:MAG: sigma-E processing peptidase SpoIIGA [Christensenellales bacterium]|jgi:stage II sporulation protein GA (sporulation sigma-E factor processing peptidase)